MAEIPYTIRRYNGTIYDTLYPRTTMQCVSGLLRVAGGGTGATNAAQARANLGAASTTTMEVDIPASGWTQASTGGYTKMVPISGITSNDNPIVDVVLGTDVDANATYLEAWATITRITTASNLITLYANVDAPSTAFKIQLKVIR